ncbi:MAG: peptidoglycan bridge formation glycyltransferase FemA/FemB family protein [Patescibacteria group bacterium]
MIIREVQDREKGAYNKLVGHIIQSWEWGQFRKSTGLDLVRLGHYSGNKLVKAYQLTFHAVPMFKQTIGYLPKGPLPDRDMLRALVDLGKSRNAAYIKIEPNVIIGDKQEAIRDKLEHLGLVESKKSLFTKYNFIIDLARTKEELMASFSQKTRYNIGVAQRKGVEVYESQEDADFEIYLKLYFDTTSRQKYFGHTPDYHKKIWATLAPANMCRLLIAKYEGKPLVAWMLFNFGDTLYYPYGGSSKEHREVMASNLVCFEAIALGKKMGLSNFDMWGALGPDASSTDPWFGFHKFKAGYGPKHVEYVGTYDLILKNALYNTLNLADRVRWSILKATRR